MLLIYHQSVLIVPNDYNNSTHYDHQHHGGYSGVSKT